MHGGKGSGAPKDNQNAKKSGRFTAKANAQRFFLSFLLWFIDRDERHLRSKLCHPLEVREFVKLLRYWANALDCPVQSEAWTSMASSFEAQYLKPRKVRDGQ